MRSALSRMSSFSVHLVPVDSFAFNSTVCSRSIITFCFASFLSVCVLHLLGAHRYFLFFCFNRCLCGSAFFLSPLCLRFSSPPFPLFLEEGVFPHGSTLLEWIGEVKAQRRTRHYGGGRQTTGVEEERRGRRRWCDLQSAVMRFAVSGGVARRWYII